jgi:hypothetical protein
MCFATMVTLYEAFFDNWRAVVNPDTPALGIISHGLKEYLVP